MHSYCILSQMSSQNPLPTQQLLAQATEIHREPYRRDSTMPNNQCCKHQCIKLPLNPVRASQMFQSSPCKANVRHSGAESANATKKALVIFERLSLKILLALLWKYSAGPQASARKLSLPSAVASMSSHCSRECEAGILPQQTQPTTTAVGQTPTSPLSVSLSLLQRLQLNINPATAGEAIKRRGLYFKKAPRTKMRMGTDIRMSAGKKNGVSGANLAS